jgi:hypothetical protein
VQRTNSYHQFTRLPTNEKAASVVSRTATDETRMKHGLETWKHRVKYVGFFVLSFPLFRVSSVFHP